jgi:hypothetical protein
MNENNVILIPSNQSLSIKIPIIKQAVYFLNQAKHELGIKLTEKGNLGKQFVQAFWQSHLCSQNDDFFRPHREFDCPEITRIHFLLSETGYLRRVKRTVRLTSKGLRFLDPPNHQLSLYADLIAAALYSWNWAYEDRYPDFEFIQESGSYFIHRLMNWPNESLTPKEFFAAIYDKDFKVLQNPDSEQIVRCLDIRFFRRFCLPFGILSDPSPNPFHLTSDDHLNKTDFFKFEFSKFFSVDQSKN